MDTPAAPLPPAQPPVQPSKGGAGKWVLFGCGGCLALIVLGLVAGAGIFMIIFGAIKSTDAYSLALKRAQESPEVQTALGTPVEAGYFVTGSVSIKNGEGAADFQIPISGPKGEGTVIVKAAKSGDGPWIYSVLEVRVTDSGQTIILLNTVPH